jgi:hypothetical protein
MQGEFAAKKYYEVVLGGYMHRARPAWRHELLTLLAAHASKRMDGSTGVEPQLINAVSGGSTSRSDNREIPRFRPTALNITS